MKHLKSCVLIFLIFLSPNPLFSDDNETIASPDLSFTIQVPKTWQRLSPIKPNHLLSFFIIKDNQRIGEFLVMKEKLSSETTSRQYAGLVEKNSLSKMNTYTKMSEEDSIISGLGAVHRRFTYDMAAHGKILSLPGDHVYLIANDAGYTFSFSSLPENNTELRHIINTVIESISFGYEENLIKIKK